MRHCIVIKFRVVMTIINDNSAVLNNNERDPLRRRRRRKGVHAIAIALPLILPYDVTYIEWGTRISSCRCSLAVAAAVAVEGYRVRGGETVRRTVRRRPTSSEVPRSGRRTSFFDLAPQPGAINGLLKLYETVGE